MNFTRILALGTILALTFSLGLYAQTTPASDSDESTMQMEDKAAPAEDNAAPATDQQSVSDDEQHAAPASDDDSKTEM